MPKHRYFILPIYFSRYLVKEPGIRKSKKIFGDHPFASEPGRVLRLVDLQVVVNAPNEANLV
jgi:hypothetical protein